MFITYLLTFHRTKPLIFALIVCTMNKESFFMFNNKFYKQNDGVAMGSPLGSALANIFCPILKINGSKIALIVRSLPSIDGMLKMYLYFFLSRSSRKI